MQPKELLGMLTMRLQSEGIGMRRRASVLARTLLSSTMHSSVESACSGIATRPGMCLLTPCGSGCFCNCTPCSYGSVKGP
jgi:hypothetical protein